MPAGKFDERRRSYRVAAWRPLTSTAIGGRRTSRAPALRAGGCQYLEGSLAHIGQAHPAHQPVQLLGQGWSLRKRHGRYPPSVGVGAVRLGR